MTIREMRLTLGDTQREFALRFHIPVRTILNWENGVRKPPQYVLEFLETATRREAVNRKTSSLPPYDSKKLDLPKRPDYLGAKAWLKAVAACAGEPIVFALDEALMCQESFLGRTDEFYVWAYGSDRLARFNGVVILGNSIDPYYVEERGGLKFTNFNRTVLDSMANEPVLDMQGITEALSGYYFTHGNSFKGIYIPPEYLEQFKGLARDAVEYYSEG